MRAAAPYLSDFICVTGFADLTPAEVGGVSSVSFGYLSSIYLTLNRYSKLLWHLPALVMFTTFYHSQSSPKVNEKAAGKVS